MPLHPCYTFVTLKNAEIPCKHGLVTLLHLKSPRRGEETFASICHLPSAICHPEPAPGSSPSLPITPRSLQNSLPLAPVSSSFPQPSRELWGVMGSYRELRGPKPFFPATPGQFGKQMVKD